MPIEAHEYALGPSVHVDGHRECAFSHKVNRRRDHSKYTIFYSKLGQVFRRDEIQRGICLRLKNEHLPRCLRLGICSITAWLRLAFCDFIVRESQSINNNGFRTKRHNCRSFSSVCSPTQKYLFVSSPPGRRYQSTWVGSDFMLSPTVMYLRQQCRPLDLATLHLCCPRAELYL